MAATPTVQSVSAVSAAANAMRGTPRSLGFRGIFCMIVTSGQTYATGGTNIPGKNISEKRGKGLTLRSFFV